MCVLSKPGRIAIMMLMVLSLLSCRMPRAPGPRPTLEKGFGSPLSTPPPPTLPTSPCLPPPDISSGETPSPLLDLRDLRWEELARPDRRLRHLPGSPYPIFPESISQDGRRLTVVWRWPLEPPLQNAGFLASAELDTEGNTHHWLIQDGSAIREKETVEEVCCWTLSDGRRLRATRTHVGLIRLILEEDHRSRVLEPPEPIRDLLLARDAVALASSPNGTVWRVDLNTGTWEKVLERERGLWGVIMARDSAYGLALQEVETPDGLPRIRIWQVPARMGAPARRIDLPLHILGSDDPNIPPTREIGNGPHWLIGVPNDAFGKGFLLDLHAGRVVRPADLGLSDWNFFDYALSPDGQWLAIAMVRVGQHLKGPEDPARVLYLAPGAHLKAGRLLEGVSIMTWGVDPPAVFLKDLQTGELRVLRLPAAPGSLGIPLAGARPPLVPVPDGMLAVRGEHGEQAVWLNLEGVPQATLDLFPFYQGIYALLPEIQGRLLKRVWIGAQAISPRSDGRCQWGLIEWIPPPSPASHPGTNESGDPAADDDQSRDLSLQLGSASPVRLVARGRDPDPGARRGVP
jgi:hypothetical protein